VVSLHAVTRNSIVVFFLTDVAVAASVDYGGASTHESTITERQASTRHVITITGLKPDSRYVYGVRAGTATSNGSFTTAVDYANAPRQFSFAVVGDARGHDTWRTVATSVLSKNPRFIIQTGDNNDSWGSAKNWENYYSAGKELFANVPIFAAQGNHDTGSNYSVYNLGPQSSSSSDLYYAFVYGNAGFVAINTNGSSSSMRSWVSGALKTLSGGPLFAFQHHPLYSCGGHGSSSSMQETYQGIFESNHLTTNYAGHDHALIVWKPVNGVRYVVSGGGGAGLYRLRGCEGPYAQSKYGFMMVSVNGPTIVETLYDQDGTQLYTSGPFKAWGEKPDFSKLGDLVVY
jgi:acid phosphatase type 7